MPEQPRALEPGRGVRLRVPANTANLGPGFDCLGMAFDWFDESTLEVLESGVEVEVTGEGADSVPRTRSHLVLQCLDRGLAALGAYAPGVRLVAHNTIPHTRGLGSSAAATVAGLLGAWALARPGEPVDRDWLLTQAHQVEGHADNVAAAIWGGFVLTWVDESGHGPGVHGVPAPVHPDLRTVVFIHDDPVATRSARGALPQSIPHADAARNSASAALLSHAIANAPQLLLPATAEWLHQEYRRDLMPASMQLVDFLRAQGFGAVISGAGPTVLVLTDADSAERLDPSMAPDFRMVRLHLGEGATAEPLG